ncbi:MAG: hypothetical protein JNL32_02935 [Candidatus Kapabacteria bacterium]|nr:hypothetical protein [Candidatus Kapabacteria bacterium]
MRKLLFSLIVVMCGIVVTVPHFAHEADGNQAVKDAQCFRYGFRTGDSLVYEFITQDTTTFPDRNALIRHRTDYVSVVCDYVDSTGSMYLRQTLESSTSKEWSPVDSARTRKKSDWIGRTAYIILAPNGKRILSKQLDTNNAANAPGGPYQHILLRQLYSDTLCHTNTVHKHCDYKSQDTLAENGYPYPLINRLCHSTLDKEIIDTFGLKCYRLTYSETGQGAQAVVNANLQVYSRSVVNQGGTVLFSTERMLPVSGVLGEQLELFLKFPNRPDNKGRLRGATRFKVVFPPLPGNTKTADAKKKSKKLQNTKKRI